MTRVAVIGAQGRMGSTSAAALAAAAGLDLVAAVDLGDALETITEARAEAALVFSTPDVAQEQAVWCLEHGVHVVIGTSGFGDAQVDWLRDVAATKPGVGVLVVPNFSVGAVLMMRFAAAAAPFMESVEVIELHHPDKIDAPSGTAVRTAELIAAARRDARTAPPPDATATDPLGARGATVDGISVHSVRARGFTASQEVVLGGPGEILSLRHDSSSRESFMPGVVAALRWIGDHPGVTVGLDPVLGLD